jgi:hypothetical protein
MMTTTKKTIPSVALALALAACNGPRATPAQESAAPALTTPGETPRAAPPPSAGPADPVLKQKIIAAMSGYEHIVTKEELDRLGDPQALTAALLDINRDQSVHLAVRTNALVSLRHYPSPVAKAAFESALLAAETPDVIRRSAVKAYGAGFGQEAVPVLARVLENQELHTRNLAVKTLAKIGGNQAQTALRAHLPKEREELVKTSLEAGLRTP